MRAASRAVVLCVFAAAAIAAPPSAHAAGPTQPKSMAALGDSLTLASNSCSEAGSTACVENSWSTGSAISSHYTRLKAKGDLARQNFASAGKRVESLNGQAQEAVDAKAEYVTIMIGTNDVCRRPAEGGMTDVGEFRGLFQAAMNTLAGGLPGARIFVASIPDPGRLFELFRSNSKAAAAWKAADNICPSFLANPTSDDSADQQRRADAHQRLVDLDRQLAEVCAQFSGCVFDSNKVTEWRFSASHVASDFFHLSAQGEAALASLTYPLAFAPAPPPPPPAPPPGPPPPGSSPQGGSPSAPAGGGGSAPQDGGAGRRSPAKLKLSRASIHGGRLDVLLGVSGRATGSIAVQYQAAGERRVFKVDLGAAKATEKLVPFVRRLRGAQRRQRSGLLTLTYDGNALVQPDSVRSRAANGRSRLRATVVTFTDGRLIARGTLADGVGDVVRLRVTYTGADGAAETWRGVARIEDSQWAADERLPPAAGADPDAYLTIQFTGDLIAAGGPYRGEQIGRTLARLPRN